MKRYHEEEGRTRREHRFHLRRMHGWPKTPIDCICELQAGRFRKVKALDCGNPDCLVCHYGKVFSIPTYKDRLQDLKYKDSLAEYVEEIATKRRRS